MINTEVLKKPYIHIQNRLFEGLMRKAVFKQLAALQHGKLTVRDSGTEYHFGSSSAELPDVSVDVLDGSFYREIVTAGSVGAGEAYMLGYWRSQDIVALVRLLLRNRSIVDGMDSAIATCVKNAINRFLHIINRNTVTGSRRNIAAHYDLGNDFFSLFLDKSMMYSAAIFPHAQASVDEAARAKLERICQKLQLMPGDHVLEIGSGWGGFALYAATHYGCRVTTTTISREQHQLTSEKVRKAGLQDRITVMNQDYRTLTGQYDKLVSIEMIEAIGHQYIDKYFEQCSRLLKANGQMLLQAITITDQRYEQAKREVDFIKKYIFPGGFLPSVNAISDAVTRKTDMRFFHLEDIGSHYALTLRHWRQRFLENLQQVKAQGFDEAFNRMWEFYLCYCEAAFLEHAVGTVQIVLTKPGCRRDSLLGNIGSYQTDHPEVTGPATGFNPVSRPIRMPVSTAKIRRAVS